MSGPLQHLAEGNKYNDQGQFSLAVREYERALELLPGWDVAETNLRLAQRRAAPVEWLKNHPEDDDLRLEVWTRCLNDGRFEDAYEHAGQLRDTEKRTEAMAITAELRERTGPGVVEFAEDQGQP